MPTLRQQLGAECLGTALLLAVVIGSGIMAQRLSGDNTALALLANTAATVGGLYVLIQTLGPISGAHFNPAVSLMLAWRHQMPRAHALPYVVAQCVGAVLGAWLAHAMFEQPLIQLSGTVRSGPGQWLAELVATAGLMLTILLAPAGQAAPRVAAYIGAAYWFTASTSFANPAATWGRMWTDSFAGIAPASVAAFVIAQLLGAWTGTVLARLLRPDPAAAAPP